MNTSMRKTRGFTLIEMIVVIAIIGITSAIVVTSLSTNRMQRETERAIHTLAANLREAQNYALSGKSTGLNQENCYYAIRFTSATQYELVSYYHSGSGTCVNNLNYAGLSSAVLSSHTLPSGTSLSPLTRFPTVFAFSLPRAQVFIDTTGVLAAPSAPQSLGANKGSQTQYLCLHTNGRIEERGTVATCP